ncbi:filamentous hemagglutinin, partial [Pseudomonas sp. URMO17WK12:I2]
KALAARATRYRNRLEGRTGTLWESRYKSSVVVRKKGTDLFLGDWDGPGLNKSVPFFAKLKGDGNMAVADVKIEGVSSQMAAHSRINNPTSAQQAQGIVGEGKGIFQTQSVPNKSGVLIPRAGDSEAKILDILAQKLGNNTAAKGTVTIFTERPACSSCLDVVVQFKAKYPNIQVNILDNKGVVMRPPKLKGN